ncbi:unnamed protein product, partial [Gulo gulo]
PRGAGRGRIREGRAAPPSVYLSPVPGAASFPVLRSQSLLRLPRRPLRPRSPGYGSVAATPSVSRPISALTALAFFSTAFFSSAEAAAASPFRSHGVFHLRLGACLCPAEQPPEPPSSCWFSRLHCHPCPERLLQPCHSWRPWGWSWTGPCSQLAGWAGS